MEIPVENGVSLCDSKICRLCGENNAIGYELFNENDADVSLRLTGLINHYLPVKVKNDGKKPRWICPGCNIQVESTVEFFDLIIRGQEKLRELYREEQENCETIPENDSPDEDSLFPGNHTLTLQMQGVDRPRRKRGRPPKPTSDILEAQRLKAEAEFFEEQRRREEQELQEYDENGGRRKRRVRIPERFRSVVQGKELEKVYVAQGVIDKTDISDTDCPIIEAAEDGSQVIGHLKAADGAVLSDLVVTQKTEFNRKGRVARLKMRFVCDVCNKTFSQEVRFLTHRATHQNVRFECTQCLQEFMKREHLKEHQVETGHIGQGIVESLEISSDHHQHDPQSAIDAVNALQMIPHEELVDKEDPLEMPQIPEIAEDFMNIPELEGVPDLATYIEESHRIPCDMCQMKFTDAAAVAVHMEAQHRKRFACNRCDKHFMLKHQLQRHHNAHIVVRPHECGVCKKRFKTRSQLQHHTMCHTQEKRYACDVCGQRFFYPGNLKHHQKRHTGQRPFVCTHCGKSFVQNSTLLEHVRVHTGERPYKCTHCDMAFKTGSQCRMHAQRHTNKRPWGCEMCGKSFLKHESYKIHMRRHRNEKIFVCQVCQRGFAEHYALKKHMRVHTGERPFRCRTCGKSFADRSNMVKHMRQMHTVPENVPDTPVVYQILNENESTPIIFVTLPRKDDEVQQEEILQNIDEQGIFSAANITLQLDTAEDYRFLLADK